jgi:hypothetical protein
MSSRRVGTENKAITRFLSGLIIFLSLLPVLLVSNPVSANPTPVNPVWSSVGGAILWVICPVIEASAIILIFKNRFVSNRAAILPFILICVLNYLTIPPTGLLYWMIYEEARPIYFVAELLPVTVEFIFLLFMFRIMTRKKFIVKPISVRDLLLTVIAVNMFTYLLGLASMDLWPDVFHL